MTDTSADSEVNSMSEYFLVDDLIVWIWCKITNCKKKEDPPAEAPPKQEKKPVKVEKTEPKNETKNASNASNGTNTSTKSTGSPAKKEEATPAKKPETDLVPEGDVLKTIREKKEAQAKEIGTDTIGTKQKDTAEEVTNSKKDMGAGPGNPYKDDANPSLATKKNATKLKENKPEAITN